MKMDKYTVKDGILYKNGEMTICPKAPPFLSPKNTNIKKIDQQDNLEETRLPCNSSCPFFAFGEARAKSSKGVESLIMENVIILHCMENKRIIRYENKN